MNARRNKKSEPLIVPRAEHSISRKNISREALKVMYRLDHCGYLAYLAGGGVRDLLLSRKPKDFDIVTDATPNRMKKVFRNCRLIGRRFRLAHVFFGDKIIEVATFRANVTDAARTAPATEPRQRPAGKHTTQVRREDGLIVRDNVYGNPEQDAVRRDFTVNAMFYDIDGFSIIDYVGGLDDLRNRLIRSIGDPKVRYVEDPVRMIRAIRFAAALDFRIEKGTYRAISRLRTHLAEASNARLYEEVQKLFLCGAAERAYAHLADTDLFEVLFPDFGRWLKRGARNEDRARFVAGLRWIDAEMARGGRLEPSLLFSVLFGEYHEFLASGLMKKGLRPSEAIRIATLDHLTGLSERVVIPKKVGYEIAHILGSQHRFLKTRGKQPSKFASRGYFQSALAYFTFYSGFTGENSDLTKWWRKFKGHAPRERQRTARKGVSRRRRRRSPAKAGRKR